MLGGPGAPGGELTIGPVDALLARRNPLRFHERVAQHGDLVKFRLGSETMFLAVHPDLVREVLVTSSKSFASMRRMAPFLGNGLITSEGEVHKRQRRLIQPAFHHARLTGYGEAMVAEADLAMRSWEDGREIDVHHEMARLALDVVGKTLFDVEFESEEAAEFRAAFVCLLEAASEKTGRFGRGYPGTSAGGMDPHRAFAVIEAFLARLIEARRADPGQGADILSMLITATDEDGSSMTDQQVRDEALTLAVAGHETLASALTWTWFLIAGHPEVEARLHGELDQVLDGHPPTVQDLPALAYTEMVLSEAMRLYPPIPRGGRRAIEDVEIGGQMIPAGTRVLFSQHVIHRDPRWYPDPLRFDPERWTPEARSTRPKFAYFPFGGGPRLCIGEAFAWMEAKLIVATLAQGWSFVQVPGSAVSLDPGVTLRPVAGVSMRLRGRASSRA